MCIGIGRYGILQYVDMFTIFFKYNAAKQHQPIQHPKQPNTKFGPAQQA
jgi:hypothetical protein